MADSLIALPYDVLPVLLIYFGRKRQDLPFIWMFFMLGAFIVACGTTQWGPTYWLSGRIKAATAIISTATAVLLIPLVPRAFALPSPIELEAVDHQLQAQIYQRQRAETALRLTDAELERRVDERTAALRRAYAALAAEISDRKRAQEALYAAYELLDGTFASLEAQQAETELQRHLQCTRVITHSLGEGVYAVDRESRVTFMNPAAESFSGWTTLELAGKHSHDLIHFRSADGSALTQSA